MERFVVSGPAGWSTEIDATTGSEAAIAVTRRHAQALGWPAQVELRVRNVDGVEGVYRIGWTPGIYVSLHAPLQAP